MSAPKSNKARAAVLLEKKYVSDADATSVKKPSLDIQNLRPETEARGLDEAISIARKINKLTGEISKLKGSAQSWNKQPDKEKLDKMQSEQNNLTNQLKSKLKKGLPSKMSGYYQIPDIRKNY